MRTLRFLIQKEFLQIFRDRFMVLLIFAVPVIQLTVLAYAATFEIQNIKIHVVDLDRSHTSKQLINKLKGSDYFIISSYSFNKKEGYEMIEKGTADLMLKVPAGFARHLTNRKEGQLQILINAINGTKAGLAQAYLQQSIAGFNQRIRTEWSKAPPRSQQTGIAIDHRNWFNPTQDYKIFMVPGILVSLVTLLAMFLSALNIVREKEVGTIEQLNVTTLKKWQFIIGKLVPFGLLALVVLAIGLIVARFVFDVPMIGSLWFLFIYAALYIVAAMGLGIFISNISANQQQAIFTSFFFMIVFILMSGIFTPIEAMPKWAQMITWLNPLAYFVKFMRMILLKGSGIMEALPLFLSISIYALVSNTIATLTYRKTAT